MVGLTILAAGSSTRMGHPKQLMPYLGRSLVRHAVETAISSICWPITLVIGAYAEQIRREIEHLPVNVIYNADWHQGMSTSIHASVATMVDICPELDAVIISLADMPLINAEHFNQLVRIYVQNAAPLIVASSYELVVGVPVLFDCSLFTELKQLKGDNGAKVILHRYHDEIIYLPVSQPALDVDTPSDYEQLKLFAECRS